MTNWLHVLPAFLQYSGLVVLTGALTTRSLTIATCAETSPALAGTVRRRLDIVLATALITLTFSAPAMFLVRAVMMSGRPIAEITPVLPTLLFHSHYGVVWSIRCLLLIALWTLALPLTISNRQWLTKLMLLLGGLVAWTLSAVGHAAGWADFSWQQLTDWLHIVSASLWAGGMLSTLYIIWPLLHSESSQNFIDHATARLSRLSEKVFLIVIATGLVNLYLQIHQPSDLLYTSYGRILSLKMLLVLLMLYFAFINRYLYLQQAQQEAARKNNWARIAGLLAFFLPALQQPTRYMANRRFFQILLLETLCMLVVLICTSVLRHGPPPPHMML